MVECRAGFIPINYAINSSGFPVTAKLKFNYSWEKLKEWVSDPTTAVIAYVPRHAVLIFAVGESNDGKYRHALIGRASGGQTPSTWVPFSEKDVFEGEDLWYPGGSLGMKDLSGLDPLFLSCNTRVSSYIACVVKRKEEIKYSPPPRLANFKPPYYMKSRELICNTCVLHKGKTDAEDHPKQRLIWINQN